VTGSLIYSIEEIKRIAVPIAQRYGVKKMALFGSYTRGEARKNSDIDILIDKGRIRGWEFCGFCNDLEDDFNLHVDVVTYDSLRDSLIPDVDKEELVLYKQ
jgi:hypothetical protein